MRAAVCLFGTIGGTKGKSGDKLEVKLMFLIKHILIIKTI